MRINDLKGVVMVDKKLRRSITRNLNRMFLIGLLLATSFAISTPNASAQSCATVKKGWIACSNYWTTWLGSTQFMGAKNMKSYKAWMTIYWSDGHVAHECVASGATLWEDHDALAVGFLVLSGGKYASISPGKC
jgi:hypothetical protein